MKPLATHQALPEALVQAAIAWAVRVNYNQPSAQDLKAFNQWLQAEPLHAIAWQRVSSFKGFEAELGPLPNAVAHDALQSALQLRSKQHTTTRRQALKLLSLTAMAIPCVWLVREQAPWQRMLADASTTVGEQKTLHLEDGSTLILNTDSAVRIALTGTERVITLLRGEIEITTGPDAKARAQQGSKRPLWVHTPMGRMQALGTRFTVRLYDARARIDVQEGAVALHPANSHNTAVATVLAGESHWLTAQESYLADSPGFAANAWVDGVVAGQNIELQVLLAELERYRHGRIVCDPRIGHMRVSGLFHLHDTDRTLQFLAHTLPVELHYRTRWWVTVAPAKNP
ncbi:FecR family protein [Lampropedia puyangensis]|uniref:FecR family protein n=1 Tax=Lampropedia puyangensis TaxID=1330072 RepID=A0A4S8FDL8_9BURK|nr:FecR family protein [Lampropedia puyangensis]THU05075.1 FecR family protein [Lampropedia puyangensis]